MSGVHLSNCLFPYSGAGVTFRVAGEGLLLVEGPDRVFGFRGLPRDVVGAIEAMAPGRSLAEAEATVETRHLALLHRQLEDLLRRFALVVGIGTEAGLVALLEPASPRVRFPRSLAPPTGGELLSRFASLRRDGSALVLESPLAHARLVVHGVEAVALLARLTGPCDLGQISSTGAPWTGPLCNVLRGSGFLTSATRDGGTAEDDDLSLGSWEFHDLLFHTRSRLGSRAKSRPARLTTKRL